MTIQALGYVGVHAANLTDWATFAGSLLGMDASDASRSRLSLRMDERQHRFIVDTAPADTPYFFGWEVKDRTALETVAARVEAAGIRVDRAPRTLAVERGVQEFISFRDPAGQSVEVFHGAALAPVPLRPGRTISGFRTGMLGLGHAVFTVEHVEPVMRFYVDVLGFRLSDYVLAPFKAYFFHVNSRHHSLALIETGRNALHHVMVEMFSLDDVGQAYDLALGQEGRIGVTLGRHTNDFMTSFYAKSPSGFLMECGWGGRDVDVANWQPCEIKDGPSLWGHERLWLSEEERAVARRMRLKAAADGRRAPVQVLAGNYHRLAGACPWVDADKQAAD